VVNVERVSWNNKIVVCVAYYIVDRIYLSE